MRQPNLLISAPFGVEVIKATLSPQQNWLSALSRVSTIIHCAARVHVMKELSLDPLSEFREVNVDGTLNLARQAAKSGVRRFIFISSIKVNGEYTNLDHPFRADEPNFPLDPYGVSKYEAEMGLRTLSRETGIEVVIIRPPLIYGPRVQANFRSMMSWLQRGIPLPFGGITKNRRSFIFLDNLVDIVTTCINHSAAANQIFLVSDGEDLSTTELLRRMYLALGVPIRLFSLPPACIALSARLIGRTDISLRLYRSLQIDMQKTMDLLGWSPPVSVDEGLRRTAAHFLKAQP
jgi:nucleoside-diphosphate-sugar epimerase